MERALSPEQLKQAFSLFNEASEQLAEAYQDLEKKVVHLTQELAVANGELRRQYLEKEALSQRLTHLLEALPGGVLVVDTGGVVNEANPAAIGMLGAAIVGAAWDAFAAERLLPTPTPHEFELFDSGREHRRRISLLDRPLDDGNGRILLLQDISEAHFMHRQLELHKRLSAMGEMAAGLAHQMRTPLATALLYTAHLTKPALQESDRLRFAEKSLARLRHLEHLIQEVLLFVRGEQGGQETVPISSLAAELQQIIEPQVLQAGLRFEFQCDAGQAFVIGQRKALLGALLNLLENAIQFSGVGGVVALTVLATRSAVSISVKDTGAGISDDVKEKLFDPFFTTRIEGTGLGLAIVRSVVKAHGGEVRLESELGKGSLFTILLPLSTHLAE